MSKSLDSQSQRTPWHRFLGKELELTVGLVEVQVESEVQISSEPPRIDVLLLRRKTKKWTDVQRSMLPDGIRDTDASHVLLEFKYSESLSHDVILQAVAYEYFYRSSRRLPHENVNIFILCSKTPQASRLAAFEFEEDDLPGVYRSKN